MPTVFIDVCIGIGVACGVFAFGIAMYKMFRRDDVERL